MVGAGMSVLPQNCSQGARSSIKDNLSKKKKKEKKKKTIVNKKRKNLRKLSSFFSYYINIQGCALAVPKSPWHPLFALEQWENHSGFHRFRALGFPSI